MPVIVRGDGAYIYDDQGKRYLDGLAGLFTVQAGHGRTELAEAAAKQAARARVLPAVVLRAPQGDRARRAARRTTRRGDLNRVFFTTGGGEAVETAWKLAKQYFKLTGKPMKHKVISRAGRLPRHPAGRAVDHRHPGREEVLRAAGARCAQGARTRTSTARPSTATTSRRSAAGPPTGSRRPSSSRAPTPSPPSSSSRCRTPAAASRRRPATSSACARSATGTTCCSSPTRRSARSAASATMFAMRRATATRPTSSPAPRA